MDSPGSTYPRFSRPTRSPMIGVTIGAYTVGICALFIGVLGGRAADMAVVGYWATIAGLCFGSVAIIAGLLDGWAPRSHAAVAHQLPLYVIGAVLFAASVVQQGHDYRDAVISTPTLLVMMTGYLLMVCGVLADSTHPDQVRE